MATFINYQDELVTCPYNRIHKVARRRFQIHLMKCAKNQDNVKLLECPFNSSHRIAPDQMDMHIASCIDSRPVLREMVERTEMAKLDVKPIVMTETPRPVDGDDWDDGCAPFLIPALHDKKDKTESINDTAIRFNDPIHIQRMSKSERKKYYAALNEKNRESISKRDPSKSSNSTVTKDDQESTMKGEQDDQKPKIKVEQDTQKGAFPRGVGRGIRPSMSNSSLTTSMSSSSLTSSIKSESTTNAKDDIKPSFMEESKPSNVGIKEESPEKKPLKLGYGRGIRPLSKTLNTGQITEPTKHSFDDDFDEDFPPL